jgi:HK97 family phage prohead protease
LFLLTRPPKDSPRTGTRLVETRTTAKAPSVIATPRNRSGSFAASGTQLRGTWAVFDTPTRIIEGGKEFMEQIARGAFARTIELNGPQGSNRILLQYRHAKDIVVGERPLGRITTLGENPLGAYIRADLYDETSYVRDLIPSIQDGLMGMSFRFAPITEDWSKPGRSASNPRGLDLRTITEARVLEITVCEWPAYPTTSVGIYTPTI